MWRCAFSFFFNPLVESTVQQSLEPLGLLGHLGRFKFIRGQKQAATWAFFIQLQGDGVLLVVR